MNNNHQKLFLFIQLLLCSFTVVSQTNTFQNKFSKLYDFTIIPKTNPNFKEYYEVTFQQTVDHSNPKLQFNQRIYIGFQDFSAPTIMVTDGYAIDYASEAHFSNELATELKANIVVVEHRFFGKSLPDSLDWNLLTMKQSAGDYHLIKSILDTILTGKWIASGISKGGQAAISYKMFYPQDINAVVAYGTALKSKQIVYTDTILANLTKTPCGKKIEELQEYLFRHKSFILPNFIEIANQKKYDVTPLDNETVLDYLLLELPFSYWQNGNKCQDIPDTNSTQSDLMSYLIKIVPPRFFSATTKRQLEPAFYMFYRELGYYEYNITPFAKYLKQRDYSNKYFAPQNTNIHFDASFHILVSSFMNSDNSNNVYLIYGQNDPWALQTSTVKNAFVVPDGSHKSRIADLSVDQRDELYNKVRNCVR